MKLIDVFAAVVVADVVVVERTMIGDNCQDERSRHPHRLSTRARAHRQSRAHETKLKRAQFFETLSFAFQAVIFTSDNF